MPTHAETAAQTAARNGDFDLKHRSRALTDGPARAPARAYLRGIGYDREALSKPIVAVANTWIETMPCNFHLRALAARVKEGIRAAGGPPRGRSTRSRSRMGSPWVRPA
jgi:dihydroxy-acid dehydratase